MDDLALESFTPALVFKAEITMIQISGEGAPRPHIESATTPHQQTVVPAWVQL